MKSFLKSIILVAGISLASVALSSETTRVCVDIKDNKGNVVKDAKGNVKQNCKEMKVHKKLEGTKVPEKK